MTTPAWIPCSVAQPPEPVDETASVRFLVVTASVYGQFVNWGVFSRDTLDGPRRWYTEAEGVVVTHWMAEPTLPGDEADPLPLATCRAMADYWGRLAAEAGQAEAETPAEIATAEYWRGRAEEAERQIRAGAIKGLGIDEDQEIV